MRLATLGMRLVAPPDEPLSTTYGPGIRIQCDLRDVIGKSIYFTGAFEPSLTDLLSSTIGPGDVVVDVGANCGYYTLLAARLVGPSGAVHAFEPAADVAERLEHDITTNNFAGVAVVHRLALADYDGDGLLVDPTDGASPTGMRRLDGGASASNHAARVPVRSLDDYLRLDRLDVVKVDAEGADARVIVGMMQTIRRTLPRLVVVEADDAQLMAFGDSVMTMMRQMSDLGYDGTPIDDPFHAPLIAFRPSGSVG